MTFPELEIRRMEERDLDEVVAIEKESFSSPWQRWMFARELAEERSRFYVAIAGEHVVGYCGLWLIADEAHIVNLAVTRRMRRKGVASALLAKALEEARAAGCTLATLEVRVSNEPALRLYEGFGFREVARRPRYYQDTEEDAAVMVASLMKEGPRGEGPVNRSPGCGG